MANVIERAIGISGRLASRQGEEVPSRTTCVTTTAKRGRKTMAFLISKTRRVAAVASQAGFFTQGRIRVTASVITRRHY